MVTPVGVVMAFEDEDEDDEEKEEEEEELSTGLFSRMGPDVLSRAEERTPFNCGRVQAGVWREESSEVSLLDEGNLSLIGCFSLIVNFKLSLETVEVNSRRRESGRRHPLEVSSSASDVSALVVVEISEILLDDQVRFSVATRPSMIFGVPDILVLLLL